MTRNHYVLVALAVLIGAPITVSVVTSALPGTRSAPMELAVAPPAPPPPAPPPPLPPPPKLPPPTQTVAPNGIAQQGQSFGQQQPAQIAVGQPMFSAEPTLDPSAAVLSLESAGNVPPPPPAQPSVSSTQNFSPPREGPTNR